MEKAVRVFVSYSHLDKRWIDRSDTHNIVPFLEASLSGRDVVFWYDLDLEPGVKFQHEIEEQIDAADIAILIVSQNFLNSDFIRRVELPRIEVRAERRELLVLPILAEHCDWEDVESLRSRQMLPGAPMPLVEYLGREADWSRVRFEILQALKKQVFRLREPAVSPAADLAGSEPAVGEMLERSQALASRIRPLPMTAFVFNKEIGPLARRAAADPDLERKAGRAAAVLYRLFAGSILLDPAAQIRDATRQALPWLKRAQAVFPSFEDAGELGRAIAFFEGLLIPLRREVELRPVIKNEFRLVMIDAPEAEVDQVSEKAVAAVMEMMKQKNGPAAAAATPIPAPPLSRAPSDTASVSGAILPGTLSEEARDAIKIGLVLGSKLTLAALPSPARSTSFSGLPFALADCRKGLESLGFNAADQSLVISRAEAALAEANPVIAAEKLLNEINRIKDALGLELRPAMMSIFRLGVSLGYILEFASILTRQGANAGQVATFEALVQKQRRTIDGDVAASGLPAPLAAVVARAGRTARTPEDLAAIIAACRELVAVVR